MFKRWRREMNAVWDSRIGMISKLEISSNVTKRSMRRDTCRFLMCRMWILYIYMRLHWEGMGRGVLMSIDWNRFPARDSCVENASFSSFKIASYLGTHIQWSGLEHSGINGQRKESHVTQPESCKKPSHHYAWKHSPHCYIIIKLRRATIISHFMNM